MSTTQTQPQPQINELEGWPAFDASEWPQPAPEAPPEPAPPVGRGPRQTQPPPGTVRVPQDAIIYAPPGHLGIATPTGTFSLDPIEAMQTINAIAEECREKTNFEWVTAFREWVRTQAGITITLAQADQLRDEIEIKYWTAKKKRLARLNSAASMGDSATP